RINEIEIIAVWRLLEKLIRLVTHRVALSAFHPVPVIVQHRLERPLVNHRLLALETRALLALEGPHRYRPKLNALHRAPRIRVALQNFNPVETRALECLQKARLRQCPRNAAAPQLGIGLHLLGYGLITHDVGNDGASALFQNAENLGEKLGL